MDNNMFNGAPVNGAAAPQPQGGQQKKGLKLDSKMMGIIAAVVVVLVVLIVAIAGSGTGKAKKAVKTYIQVFLTGEKRDNDVKWTKFYPKDFDRELEDWAEKTADSVSKFKDVEGYKVLSVTKVGGKDMKKILEDYVDDFFTGEVSYMSGKEIKDRDLKDLKVSKGYLVTTQFEYDRKLQVNTWLVIKVNGKYGVYNVRNIINES